MEKVKTMSSNSEDPDRTGGAIILLMLAFGLWPLWLPLALLWLIANWGG